MQFQEAQRITRVKEKSRRPATGVVGRPGVVKLSSGEPDFATPQPVIDAMAEALNSGWTHYVPAPGVPELREKIASTINSRYGTSYEPSNVLLTHGGSAGITTTMMTLVDPGQAVVVADPTYSLYADAIALAGGKQITVPVNPGTEDEGVLAMAAAAREHNAALLVLCNPVNPTGAVYSAEALEKLAEELEGTDCLVLSDEAYQDILHTDAYSSSVAIASLRARLIFCQTFSKTFAMTGWRLGYLVADDAFIKIAGLFHKTMTGALNGAVQVAAIKALETQTETVPPMAAEYRARRKLVLERLSRIPGVTVTSPDATFYLFIHYDLNLPSEELRKLLSEKYGVEVRAGSEYGDNGEQHIRISYAYSRETLRKGLSILEKAFRDLTAQQAVESAPRSVVEGALS